MQRVQQFVSHIALGATVLLLGACVVSDATDKSAADTLAAGATTGSTPISPPGPAPAGGAVALDSAGVSASSGSMSPDSVTVSGATRASDTLPLSTIRLEVDVAARRLTVYDRDRSIATHAVAVGSPEWPTRTGEWNVQQVVWNPEWTPPDESWAEQRTPKKSGAPDNPLGRAQLVYDPPRTIHGTNDPASIGKAVSHGSIRLPNAVVVQLGRQLMEATGAGKDEAWYREAQQKRTEKRIVDLPQRVPIRVF